MPDPRLRRERCERDQPPGFGQTTGCFRRARAEQVRELDPGRPAAIG